MVMAATNPKERVFHSQGALVRELLNIKGDGNYTRCKKHKCSCCGQKLWRFKFNGQFDGLKCRNTNCFKLNSLQGYIKRKVKVNA